jgi:two-component system chemotaxis sensor kinase CheA
VSLEFSDEDFQLFIEEGRAHLRTLEQSLLTLEDQLSAPLDLALVNEMFRAAHSIKGAAGMLGLKAIQGLTHQLENLLGQMREGKRGTDSELLETLFQAVDVLGTLMVEVSGADHQTVTDPVDTVLRLKQLAAGTPEPLRNAGDSQLPFPVPAALEAALNAHAIDAARCAMRAGRYLYQATLDLDGCTYRDGMFDHPVLERLFALSELVALQSDPPVPPEGTDTAFPIKGFALVQSSADPSIMAMLVPLDGEALKLTYDPANPPAAPAAPVVKAAVQDERPPAKPETRPTKEVSQSIRVDVGRLDELMNVVGEIVIGNSRLAQLGAALEHRYDHDATVQQLNESLGLLARMVGDLQRTVISTRMIPVERVFNRFPRLVRDLARSLGKEIKLELSGQETEVDKTVSEELEDPLVHLLRNAVDHGIEMPDVREAAGKPRGGTLHLSARHEGNHIVIALADDGGGINPEKVLKKAVELGLANRDLTYPEAEIHQFIMLPGFSTADQVTDVSGRGVGMDVVNQNIRKLKGSIHVESERGKGTTFIVKLPLTLAITKALLVSSGGELFAIPLESVRESLRLAVGDIKTLHGRSVAQLREAVLPLLSLQEAFGYDRGLTTGRHRSVVVVGDEKKQVGLIVDRLEGEQDVVVKSMGTYLGDIPGVAGATILGDGRVALILDINALLTELSHPTRHADRPAVSV